MSDCQHWCWCCFPLFHYCNIQTKLLKRGLNGNNKQTNNRFPSETHKIWYFCLFFVPPKLSSIFGQILETLREKKGSSVSSSSFGTCLFFRFESVGVGVSWGIQVLLLLQGAAGHEVKALLPQPGQRRPVQLLHHWGHQASAADLTCSSSSRNNKKSELVTSHLAYYCLLMLTVRLSCRVNGVLKSTLNWQFIPKVEGERSH